MVRSVDATCQVAKGRSHRTDSKRTSAAGPSKSAQLIISKVILRKPWTDDGRTVGKALRPRV